MTTKTTVRAPSNIALVKYWGKSDASRNWPAASSLSMTLSACYSESSFSRDERDRFILNGLELPLADPAQAKVMNHLKRLKTAYAAEGGFLLESRNSFPTGAGIASSASGMAAMTLAFDAAMRAEQGQTGELPGLDGDGDVNRQIAELARRGSGSACRSLAGGFVEWQRGDGPDRQRVRPIAAAAHWQLHDTIILVSQEHKAVTSSLGHTGAAVSPLFPIRQSVVEERLAIARSAVLARDLQTLGPIIEAEATDMHAIMLTQSPSLHYFNANTVFWIEKVRSYRSRRRKPVFWTLDAGPNLHVLCEEEEVPYWVDYCQEIDRNVHFILDHCGMGPCALDDQAEPY